MSIYLTRIIVKPTGGILGNILLILRMTINTGLNRFNKKAKSVTFALEATLLLVLPSICRRCVGRNPFIDPSENVGHHIFFSDVGEKIVIMAIV